MRCWRSRGRGCGCCTCFVCKSVAAISVVAEERERRAEGELESAPETPNLAGVSFGRLFEMQISKHANQIHHNHFCVMKEGSVIDDRSPMN